MCSSEYNVELPLVKLDLLATDTAHAVDHDQSVRADPVDKLAEGLDLAEHTGARVNVGDGQDLVLLLLQCFLDLVELRAFANGRLQLCRLGAICFEAVGERVGEVPSVQDEDVIAGLGKVGGDLVPAKGAGAGEDERLRGRMGGLEELAQVREDVAEGVDEWLADMGFAAKVSTRRGRAGRT